MTLAEEMEQVLLVAALRGIEHRGVLSEDASAKLRALPAAVFARCDELANTYAPLAAEALRVYRWQAGAN